MENKPNNPSAFPAMDMNNHYGVDRLELRNEGMSLRDYFAAKAMQAMLTGIYTNDKPFSPDDFMKKLENVVSNSYYMADAMLKKREL